MAIVLFAITFVLYPAVLLLIARYYWKRFKQDGAAKAFNFRITDIWAAMAGLSPTIVIASLMLEDSMKAGFNVRDILGTLFIVALLWFGQVAGCFVGRVHLELPPHQGATSTLDSAISIFTGAWIGLFFPFCYILLVGTITEYYVGQLPSSLA